MRSVYVGIAVFALGFFAGAGVNGWRVGKQKAEQKVDFLAAEVKEQEAAFKAVGDKLQTVVNKSQAAADATTATLARLTILDQATNKEFSAITSRTQRISNEINTLGVPKCQYTFEYGRMYEEIGKGANAPRHALYGTESRNPGKGDVHTPVPGVSTEK